MQLTCDVKIPAQWLSHDVFLARWPSRKERQELFRFYRHELSLREALSSSAASSADSRINGCPAGFAAVNQS